MISIVSMCDTAHSSEKTANNASPIMKMRRRPRMSPARPPSSSSPPKVRAYPLTTHWRSRARSPGRSGSTAGRRSRSRRRARPSGRRPREPPAPSSAAGPGCSGRLAGRWSSAGSLRRLPPARYAARRTDARAPVSPPAPGSGTNIHPRARPPPPSSCSTAPPCPASASALAAGDGEAERPWPRPSRPATASSTPPRTTATRTASAAACARAACRATSSSSRPSSTASGTATTRCARRFDASARAARPRLRRPAAHPLAQPPPGPLRRGLARPGRAAARTAASGRSASSNFKPAHLDRVIAETGVAPDVNQIQLNPAHPRRAARLRRRARHRHRVVEPDRRQGGGLLDEPVSPAAERTAGRPPRSFCAGTSSSACVPSRSPRPGPDARRTSTSSTSPSREDEVRRALGARPGRGRRRRLRRLGH